MNSKVKLIYAYDPLCGWCYGLIPALRHFVARFPEVQVEVLPGGLFTGTPPRPYASLIPHIRQAEVHLEQVTGRKPSEVFHRFIAQKKTVDASSERPGQAVLQVNELSVDHALEFAHRLQEMHYEEGADLNEPEVYDDITEQLGLPKLDTQKIVNATLKDPMIAKAYARCNSLQPRGYPTVFVASPEDKVLGSIPSTYEPDAFLNEFRRLATE